MDLDRRGFADYLCGFVGTPIRVAAPEKGALHQHISITAPVWNAMPEILHIYVLEYAASRLHLPCDVSIPWRGRRQHAYEIRLACPLYGALLCEPIYGPPSSEVV